MKHTKGPWKAKGNDPTVKANHISGPNGESIAYCVSPYVFDTGKNIAKQYEANAALIEAAPDLLEACELLVKSIMQEQLLGHLPDYTVGFEAAFDNAQTAIKAARGES